MSTLRITAKNSQEIEGLGYELTECSDREAELFALEELQPDGRWLTLDEYATRGEADVARQTGVRS